MRQKHNIELPKLTNKTWPIRSFHPFVVVFWAVLLNLYFKRAVERDISELEIRQAGEEAEIIESYPDDKYAPSCLLLGFTKARRPLHLQVSCLDTPVLKIITLYEPDRAKWYNYSRQRV
ncbi:MAG: hypothetical protein B6243_12310 [Anaerolineaceae bacterium 4572_5.2]|nr:MAG: hypothetical protein B6243_12310 [Anaerolineaceae bacterium 4572_5.2]